MMPLHSRLALLGGVALVALAVATQDFAHHYDYAPSLGPGLGLDVYGHRLYPPWEIVRWSKAWGLEVREGLISAARGVSLMFGVVAAVALVSINRRAVRPFGRHRLGTLGDARRSDLLAPSGIVLGRMPGAFGWPRILRDHSDRHLLVLGATRSGKGVGVVVPTLLDGWRHSAVVWDPKGELHAQTARARPGRVLLFDPMSPASCRYNPLAEIRVGTTFAVGDAQAIAEILVDPAAAQNAHDFWDRSAASLLTAIVLHVASTGRDRTLGRVRDMAIDIEGALDELRDSPCAEAKAMARNVDKLEDRVRSSIEATVQSHLGWLADEMVRQALSGHDLWTGDLMCGAEPVTLYLACSPANAVRLRPLVRLMLQQIIRGLTGHIEHDDRGRAKRHPLLMMVDELPQLGKLPVLETALAIAAGYGVRFALVAQSLTQIERVYPSMVDNCGLIWARPSNDERYLQRLADMIGRTTEMRRSVSRWTSTWSEQTRPVMEGADIRELPDDRALLFVQGARPLIIERVIWHRMRPWRRWAVKGATPEPVTIPTVPPLMTTATRTDDFL